ncbi:MAG: DegV family protein [Oscillospiraceae bacterium]|nr:DegV family protein [Oscillospiraceae bacterium]
MSNFKIFADSCCDYPDETCDISWLTKIQLTIGLDGVEYRDDDKLDCLDLLKKMDASDSAPKSACPSSGDYFDAFNCGVDDIYVVTLSEKLSGSYNSARLGADLLKESDANKNIYVFNSRSAACGEVDICLKINELASKGLEFNQVVSQVESFIDSLETMFVLEDLSVFRKSGRLNHLQAIVTSTLKLKMVMGAEPDGSIAVRAKALTTSKALSKLVELVIKKSKEFDPASRILVITHCNCYDRAKKVCDDIMESCKFNFSVICRASGISTIYANDGGIIVSF